MAQSVVSNIVILLKVFIPIRIVLMLGILENHMLSRDIRNMVL